MPNRNFAPIQLAIPDSIRSVLARLSDDSQHPSLGARAQAGEDGTPELHIFGVVGDRGFFGDEPTESTTDGVSRFLSEHGGQDVRVLINSPGGFAFEGIAIYNLLASHSGNVTTRNIGMAGSAASIILMSGDTIEMHDSATLFIHRALTVAIGNTEEIRDTADFLDQLDGQMAAVYAARTGKTKAAMSKLMRGEGKRDGTFLSAAEAKAEGFITTVIPSKKGEKGGKAKAEAPVEPEGAFTPEEEAAAVDHEAIRNRVRLLAVDEHEALSYLERVA